jgi:hypothetical protein
LGGVALDAHLSNGQIVGWGFTSAEKQVASLKDRGIVLFSSTIFLFGVAIQFISRAVHNPKQHDPNSKQETNTSSSALKTQPL